MAKIDGDWSLNRPRLSLKANSCTALHIICMNYAVKAHVKLRINSTRIVPRSRISRDCQGWARNKSVKSHPVHWAQTFPILNLIFVNSPWFCGCLLRFAAALRFSAEAPGYCLRCCLTCLLTERRKVFNNVKSSATSGATVSTAPLSYVKRHCESVITRGVFLSLR